MRIVRLAKTTLVAAAMAALTSHAAAPTAQAAVWTGNCGLTGQWINFTAAFVAGTAVPVYFHSTASVYTYYQYDDTQTLIDLNRHTIDAEVTNALGMSLLRVMVSIQAPQVRYTDSGGQHVTLQGVDFAETGAICSPANDCRGWQSTRLLTLIRPVSGAGGVTVDTGPNTLPRAHTNHVGPYSVPAS